ncbi:MAG: acyl carrier protein [Syntrophomonas sp.]
MEEQIYVIINKIIGIPLDKITKELSPDNVEVWDSLLHMELLVSLEEEFGIEFSDEQIAKSMSVGEIIDIIVDLMNLNK